MSLPYFTRGTRVFDRGMPDGLSLLLYPDAFKRLDGLLTKPLSDMQEAPLKSLLSGLHFVMSTPVRTGPQGVVMGDVDWTAIIQTYVELLRIVVPLGHADALYALYLEIMEPLAEAQQDLFNRDQQLKALASEEEEVRFAATMEVYLALYEGLVKVTTAFPVFCLDLIAGPSYPTKPLGRDAGKKSHADYVRDDLSYKRTKILAAAGLGLTGDPSVLLTGVEPHLRNAIAHKRFEYAEDGRVTFRDVDRSGTVVFERTMRLGAFEWITKTLRVNFLGQGAALSLFPFEFGASVNVRPEMPTKPKAVKGLVYSVCQEVKLEPTDIRLEGDELVCTLFRSSALDNPSSVFANLGGVRMGQDFPPLPLPVQLETLAARLAERNAPVSTAEFCVQDHDGAPLGRMKVDIAGLRQAITAGAPFPPFASFIMPSDTGQPSTPAEATSG